MGACPYTDEFEGQEVMVRGVARTDLCEQLFAAADRILARDGAVGLTSRAITDEAGCAKGILYNHFESLDGFLTDFAVDRLRGGSAQLSALATRAGHGDVVENLTDAAVALFGSGAVTVAALVAGKPALAPRITAAVQATGPTLQATEHAFADYLAAEQRLDRIKKDIDIEVLAFTLVGSVHHLFFTGHGATLDRDRVRKIVTTLLRL
jgi:AcrR family transcriptional regulator